MPLSRLCALWRCGLACCGRHGVQRCAPGAGEKPVAFCRTLVLFSQKRKLQKLCVGRCGPSSLWMCVLSSALICNALAWRCSRRRDKTYIYIYIAFPRTTPWSVERREGVWVGLARCGIVFLVSVVVGAAVPAAVCRWGLFPRCLGMGRCLSGYTLAFTRYCFASKLYHGSPSSLYASTPLAKPALLLYYRTTIGQYTPSCRAPFCMPWTIQYWWWQYRVKAKVYIEGRLSQSRGAVSR